MDPTSKYAATRITSRKNTSSLQETLTQGGTRLRAENYLQHAEHYFRLIAAAQAAQALAQSGQQRPPGEDEDDLDDDGDFGGMSDRFASPAERQHGFPAAATGISTPTERRAERPTAVR